VLQVVLFPSITQVVVIANTLDRHDHGCFGLTWFELISLKYFSSLA